MDTSGNVESVYTNPFGYYQFGDVAAGETYIFTVSHKQYIFAPQIIFFIEDGDEINFVALPKIRFK